MKQRSLSKARQQGYTVVELGIALSIIAILIVAGLAGINQVLASSRANTQIEDSGRAMGKLQGMITSTNVANLSTAAAVGMGLFPPTRVAANVVTTAIGGGNEFVRSNAALTAATNGLDLAAGAGVIYTLTAIPRATCAELVSSLAALAQAAYVYNATPTEATADANTNLTGGANGTIVRAPGGAVDGTRLGTQCNLANTVSASFVLRP